MNRDQLYQELLELAERLQITVSEQNLKTSGFKVKSGFCKIRGQNMFVMDKHKSIREKIRLLAELLADTPHENIFIVPAVRELLEKHKSG